jgi:hypothetical protein
MNRKGGRKVVFKKNICLTGSKNWLGYTHGKERPACGNLWIFMRQRHCAIRKDSERFKWGRSSAKCRNLLLWSLVNRVERDDALSG